MIIIAIFSSAMVVNMSSVYSATSQFRGVNWADQRDNFQTGNLYVSGLSSSDNYSSAAAVADRVVGQFVSKLGANSVRMPINETTVNGSYWNTYTGAIDKALTYGKVVLCWWSPTRGVPVSMTDWWNMWSKVVNKYGSNSNCYFEIINEPNMYNATDLCNLYNEWVNNRFNNIPKDRIILDGTYLAQGVSDVGRDSRLSNCLLAVHEYTMFVGNPYTSEAQWQSHFQSYVGNYANRTVCTEWGYPNSPGSKNGVYYDYIDYNANSGGSNYFYYYTRGISKQLRSWGMGSFYWPGLRDGDWYSMTNRSGSGANINLSIPNASGLYWLQYAWGEGLATNLPTTQVPDSYVKIRNASTGLYIDGMGRTSNGADCGLYSSSSSSNQQWNIINIGDYVMIQNRATGLYIDGMGRTSNGNICGQWSNSNSNNQQWVQESSGGNIKFKNRATGLYLDGMGYNSNGSNLCQWSSSTSENQLWIIE
jgi:hypothetical protein